ncbi:unnamed protein product [Polarella glacialis]|uniref:Protochlorophyllide reductase n=1 Tax=Polarella glacialis TaxID=89957 RepID=A0A813HDG3_POLGL|nr:unnamed protein product [Polarella glacialis]
MSGAAASAVKERAWDVVGIGTVAVLGILGVRRRHEADLANPDRVLDLRPSSQQLDVTGARCIVTGASSGMGAEVAWGLARAGADRVDMACRDLKRCEQARADLLARCIASSMVADGGAAGAGAAQRCSEVHQRCSCALLELTDPASVRSFAEAVSQSSSSSSRIVLVNNAGVMGNGRPTDGDATCEGASEDPQLQTNHYGHFLLTRLLLPNMGPGSCVAVVASRAHYQGSLAIHSESSGGVISSEAIDGMPGLSRILGALGFSWYARYARSKLCNVLFAAELRRRSTGPEGPACVAVSPGLVHTGLFAGTPSLIQAPLDILARKFFQTPAEGAAHILTAIAAVLSEDGSDVQQPPPLYWHCGEPQQPSAAAQNEELAAALWRASEVAVGL